MAAISEKRIHAAFEIGIILKGLNALAELIAGVVLYFTSVETLTAIVKALVHDELLADPHDLIANALMNMTEHFNVGGKRFAALYLLSHGLVKLVLVVGLLRNQRWAYPASLIVLAAFVLYQLYRLTFGFSVALIALTLFDFVVIALIWHEYRLVRAGPAPA